MKISLDIVRHIWNHHKKSRIIINHLCVSRKMSDAPEPKSEDGFTMLNVDGWDNRWKLRKIGFHRDVIHNVLEKYVDRLIANREYIKIFVPLCGKSLDMKWLADRGHTIVGVEGSEIALQEFFDEQKLEFSVEPADEVEGKVFKSKDGKIILYCCDFFKFTKDVAGQFNGIWDRGSFVAINRHDRERYALLIQKLMAPDCQYLLDTFDYNESLYSGPPHFVPVEQINTLFGEKCDVEHLTTFDAFEEKHKGWGLDYFHERVHLLSLKK